MNIILKELLLVNSYEILYDYDEESFTSLTIRINTKNNILHFKASYTRLQIEDFLFDIEINSIKYDQDKMVDYASLEDKEIRSLFYGLGEQLLYSGISEFQKI